MKEELNNTIENKENKKTLKDENDEIKKLNERRTKELEQVLNIILPYLENIEIVLPNIKRDDDNKLYLSLIGNSTQITKIAISNILENIQK